MKRIVLSALVALGVAGCGRPTVHSSAPPAVEARVATVEASLVPTWREVAARWTNRHSFTLVARVAGTVTTEPLVLGRVYTPGENLLTLSAPELEQRLAQAEARWAQATREREREERLHAQGVTPWETVLALREHEQVAFATREEAKAILAQSVVRVAQAGRLARAWVKPGDTVLPGQPLADVEGTGELFLEAQVPAGWLGQESGAPQLIEGTETRELRISETSPRIEGGLRVVRLQPLDSVVVPQVGRAVSVRWPGRPTVQRVVPQSAVQARGEIDTVWVVVDGRAQLRVVRLAGPHASGRVVLSGLSEGEQVVLSPPVGLREQSPVRLLP